MADFTFVLAEKPAAAERIAVSLGKPRRKFLKGVPYYEVSWREKNLIIAPALGHLYTLAPSRAYSRWPCFTLRWQPTYEGGKHARRHQTWLASLEVLSRGASEYISSCDVDVEGSLIAYNVFKYCCKAKLDHARRTKFSTLAMADVRAAFDGPSDELDYNFILAGRTRHTLDWIYGVNISRLLMLALKRASRFAVLSAGRVQSPTLMALNQREEKIEAFVPIPFYEITADAIIASRPYHLRYWREKVAILSEAERIREECRGKEAIVTSVKMRFENWPPPPPFDLGALQSEAYRLFKYPPSRTLRIAENLYLAALISYPRTASQKLPPSIGYEWILSGLSRSSTFAPLVDTLLSEVQFLKPREGKKTDPAHPAVYPTGNLPTTVLRIEERRVFDLIVRRFLAVFSEDCERQNLQATVTIAGHRFRMFAARTLHPGWVKYYGSYNSLSEQIVPEVAEGDVVQVSGVQVDERLTTPPSRYNPASLLRYMERSGLGTKATRSETIDTLYKRGYAKGVAIQVTPLGAAMAGVLARYFPEIVSVGLTREFERAVEGVVLNDGDCQRPILESLDLLRTLFHNVVDRLGDLSKGLQSGLTEARREQRYLGTCPRCKVGRLQIIRSKKTGKRFAGCSEYFQGKCSFTTPLPQFGSIRLGSQCSVCSFPTIIVGRAYRRPWILCINPDCPKKHEKSRQ